MNKDAIESLLAREGWGKLSNTAKWHYFSSGGVSLCRKWMALGNLPLEQGNNDSTDNCRACRLPHRPSLGVQP